MPTYEYLCSNAACKHAWEAEQRITDKPLERCPRCKRKTAKRQISRTGFVLQGTGWARDGYGNVR